MLYFCDMEKELLQLGERRLTVALKSATVDIEKRTVDVVYATETPVLTWDWSEGQFYEVLAITPEAIMTERLDSGAPVLNSHNKSNVLEQLGVIDRHWIADGQAWATIRLSKRPELDSLLQDIADGIVRNISAGYRVWEYTKVTTADSIPTYRATKWEPHEVSWVTVPADVRSGVRSQGESPYTAVVISDEAEQQQSTNQSTTSIMTDEKNKGGNGGGDNPPVVVPAVQTDAERLLTVKEERERGMQIREAVRTAKLPDALADELVNEGVDINVARERIIKAFAAADPTKDIQNQGGAHLGKDREAEGRSRGMEMGLLLRAGQSAVTKNFSKEDLALGNQYRSYTLMDMARMFLEAKGVNTRGMNPVELAGRALASTSDFSVMLGGIIHQVLLTQYEFASNTWSQWCRIGSVTDFRNHDRLRSGTFGLIDDITEGGEYKTKKIADGAKETISIGSKGNRVGITRQAIINDSLGFLNDVASGLGRSMAYTIEDAVYKKLIANPNMNDSVALFHSSHGNLAASGTAPSVDSLKAVRIAMGKQKDVSGNMPIVVKPWAVLCSLELADTFRELNQMQFNSDSQKEQQKPNVVRGMFSQVIETPLLTGNAWYVVADPQMFPAMEVAFLNGNQTPFIQQKETTDIDGVEYLIRHDWGVAPMDYRGIYKNPGA